MSDSDAPRFQVGDRVRWTERSVVGGRHRERSGTVSAIGPRGAMVAFREVSRVGQPYGGSTHVQFGGLTLLQPALYLDEADVKALEQMVYDHLALRHSADTPQCNACVRAGKALDRAKRAPALTETENDD